MTARRTGAAKTVLHDKRETIARVEKEYRALDRIIRKLGASGLEERVPGFGARARVERERWLRRDALAHIVEWKRQQLRALRKERSDPELRGLKIEEKNRVLYERWHSRPAAAVVAYHRRVQREIGAAMRALPPAYYARRFSLQWPNDLVGHSTWHREHHLEND